MDPDRESSFVVTGSIRQRKEWGRNNDISTGWSSIGSCT